jgi:hypothetical protein
MRGAVPVWHLCEANPSSARRRWASGYSADEAVATRRAIYAMWQRRAAERTRTMGYLACCGPRKPRLNQPRMGIFQLPQMGSFGLPLTAAWRSGQWGRRQAGSPAPCSGVWLVVGILSGRARRESRGQRPWIAWNRGGGCAPLPPQDSERSERIAATVAPAVRA